MGSGSKRNLSDNIAVGPKYEKSYGGQSGGRGGRSTTQDKCPVSFKNPLPDGMHLVNGMKLDLKSEGQVLKIYFGSTFIINLNPSKQILIQKCIESGFRYDGEVKTDGKKSYAEFKRRTA